MWILFSDSYYPSFAIKVIAFKQSNDLILIKKILLKTKLRSFKAILALLYVNINQSEWKRNIIMTS